MLAMLILVNFFFLWIQTISFKRLGLTLGESGQVGLEFEVILSKCNCRGKSLPIEILIVKVYTKGNC